MLTVFYRLWQYQFDLTIRNMSLEFKVHGDLYDGKSVIHARDPLPDIYAMSKAKWMFKIKFVGKFFVIF